VSAWVSSLSASDQWALGIVAILIVGIISQWAGQRINHSLVMVRERNAQANSNAIAFPKFWSLTRRYKILAVHKYKASNDISGFTHLSQNSRTDQWQQLIKISPLFFGFRYNVTPIDSEDILDVVISRDAKEQWKVISFNK
jgi:alcohol dehydrogenase YqhD (iron-dependent ADH family)